jgi:chemotaxis protein MotB
MHFHIQGRTVLLILLTLGVFSLAGCVSSGKYKKLESEKTALQGQVTALEQEKAQLSQQRDDLSQQKEDLTKSGQKTESAYNALLNQMADEVQKGQLQITQYKNMLNVDIADRIFFASGSATLKAGGKDVLTKLAKALANYPDKIIWVVGHTDNVPVSKAIQATYPSNWELSVIRATNVVRFLQDKGVLSGLLIASGRAEFAPIADNSTPEGRQKNRRIEIKLIDKNLLDSMKQGDKPAPPAQSGQPAQPAEPAAQPAQ